jgi:hypothetical protein
VIQNILEALISVSEQITNALNAEGSSGDFIRTSQVIFIFILSSIRPAVI